MKAQDLSLVSFENCLMVEDPLAMLQAEIDIIVLEYPRWTRDRQRWERPRPLPPGVATPSLVRARLLSLVDEYEREGALSPIQIRAVRAAIEHAIDNARAQLAHLE